MNRRHFLIGAAALLPSCTMFGTAGGDAQIQDTYKNTIAAMDAAGVLFNGGAALVTAGVIKPASTAWVNVDGAFKAVAAALDALNADIQGSMVQPVAALLDAVRAALAAADTALAQNQPKTAQAKAVIQRHTEAARARQQKFAIGGVALIGLITQLLPVIISAGGELADLIKGLINSSGNVPPSLSPADVNAADMTMHAALANWDSAQPA